MNRCRSISIQKRLIKSFSLLFITILLLLLSVVVVIVLKNQSNQYELTLNRISEQISITVDSFFSELSNLLVASSLNTSTLNAWRNINNPDSYDAMMSRESIKDIFVNCIQTRSDIVAISIFDDSSYIASDTFRRYTLSDSFIRQVWSDFSDDQRLYIKYYPVHTLNYLWRLGVPTPQVISLAYPVRDYEHLSKSNDAVMMFEVSYNYFCSLISQFDEDSTYTILVLSDVNEIIYSSSDNYQVGGCISPDNKFNFPGMMVGESTSQSNNWKTIVLCPESELRNTIAQMIMLILALSFLVFVVVIFVIVAISKQIASPITALSNEMNRVTLDEHSSLTLPDKQSVPLEIESLYSKYNSLMGRIASLKMKSYEAELKQKDADYRALQAQINPHFLNNVLQTIQSLALMQKTKEIQYVTTSMGNLIEYTLYAKSDFVTLADELRYIRCYLDLYKFRLGPDFSYDIDVESILDGYILPRFLIQPIVENSVLHGFKSSTKKKIIIEAIQFEDSTIVNVRDNGVGICSEEISDIKRKLKNSSSLVKSIGLCNVNQRIKMLYGEQFGLELQSQPGFGTCVSLVLPKDSPHKIV